MDIDQFRTFCMALDGVTEKTPFGKFSKRFKSLLVFYVKGHMFCSFDMEDFTHVNLRSTPEEIADLESRHAAVGATLNPAMKYWISVSIGGDIPDAEIYRLTARAYDIIKAKYSRQTKQ